jgi:SAM-dependent methyltransferase
MTSFAADDAGVYERMMGRWSRRLAARFIEFAAIGGARSILDVGCGTGSLTFGLAAAAPAASIVGIDLSRAFVDYARSKAADPRLTFDQGDAMALPQDDRVFDATLSLLVLNFVSDPRRAIQEMTRVTRPGGVVAASVWDFRGGLPHQRVFLDTAAVIDPVDGNKLRSKMLSMPLTGPGELADAWMEHGLLDVEQTSLTVRIELQSFADYWEPWQGGQGMVGPYLRTLDEEKRMAIEHHLRQAYQAGGEDGLRSFTGTAWAVRGMRPLGHPVRRVDSGR